MTHGRRVNNKPKKVKMVKALDTKKDIIGKHNYLTEAKYRITLQEARVFAWLVSEIYKDDEDANIFKIPVADLATLAGLKNKNAYEQMKQVTEKLTQRFISIRDLEKSRHLQATLVASADYEDHAGTVEIEVSSKLKPYLLSMKGGQVTYTSLACTLALKSSYSIRIYDLLAQYRRAGERTIEVQRLKEILGIDGQKAYNRFDNLETKVIKVAYQEINEKTDIRFEYEKQKKGRRIHAIRFIIKSQKKQESEALPSPAPESELVEQLEHYGVSRKVALSLADTKPDKTMEALQAIKNKSPRDPAGYLVKFINENWEDGKAKQAKKKVEEAKTEARQQAIRDQHERQKREFDQNYRRQQEQQIIGVVSNWSDTEEKLYWGECKKFGDMDMFASFSKKKGIDKWTAPMHKSFVREYLIAKHGQKFITEEDFLKLTS